MEGFIDTVNNDNKLYKDWFLSLQISYFIFFIVGTALYSNKKIANQDLLSLNYLFWCFSLFLIALCFISLILILIFYKKDVIKNRIIKIGVVSIWLLLAIFVYCAFATTGSSSSTMSFGDSDNIANTYFWGVVQLCILIFSIVYAAIKHNYRKNKITPDDTKNQI